MRVKLWRVASAVIAVAAAVGGAYLAVALATVRAFTARPAAQSTFTPPITVLKPLHGAGEHLAANLASFCAQEYPLYQTLFCVAEGDDAALSVAEGVAAVYCADEHNDVGIVVAPPVHDVPNPKIANVLNGEGRIAYDIIVIADADMHVPPNYLRAIAAPFADREVGAVTCLYGAVPAQGTVSVLGAMDVNDRFAPSVLVAQRVEAMSYCFGSAMAVRRSVMAEIGGLRALGATLADDHALGERVSARGYRVALARCVAQTFDAERRLQTLWRRELRWARVIRSVRPVSSAFAVVTHAWPLAAFAWACAPPSPLRSALFAGVTALRVLLHDASRHAFAPGMRSAYHLIPLRDTLSLLVWIASRLGDTVEWGGRTLSLRSDRPRARGDAEG